MSAKLSWLPILLVFCIIASTAKKDSSQTSEIRAELAAAVYKALESKQFPAYLHEWENALSLFIGDVTTGGSPFASCFENNLFRAVTFSHSIRIVLRRRQVNGMAEDRELTAMLKAGSTDALEQLILRWRSRAEAYASSILHDSQAAEDAVQEAFSRIYALRKGLNDDCSFSAYLFTIVKRICLDELRKQKRSPDLPGVLPDLPVQSAEEEYLSHWDRLSRIHLLASLNEADRKLLLAFSLEGRTARQIAEEMNLPEGLIRVRLFRIRKKLKGMSNDAQ